MQGKLFYKSIIGCLVVSLIGTIALFAVPLKTHAQEEVDDPVTEAETTATTIETGSTATSALGLYLKSFTLDKIATAIAKQILMQITLSVVNWINSGFNGNPSFLTNPAAFFANIGDQLVGQFIAGNGTLSQLCGPWNLNIRLALIFRFSSPKFSVPRYSCTLSTLIKNAKNAKVGASISGFAQGDYSQGGLPAYASMTMQMQNNSSGAFLLAQNDLEEAMNSVTSGVNSQLNQGHGFLSWPSCTTDSEGDENCEVATPGSVISDTLSQHLGVPTDELLLANDINAIINAAFSQLVIKVLGGGLTSVSASGSAGGGSTASFTAQLQTQQNQNSSFSSTQSTFVSSVDQFVQSTSQIAQDKDTQYTLIQNLQNNTNTAISVCQENGINSIQGANELNSILTTEIAPLVVKYQSEAATADSTRNALISLENAGNSAQSASDLSAPSQTLTNMIQAGQLPTALDVSNSASELSKTQSNINTIQGDVSQIQTECQNDIHTRP